MAACDSLRVFYGPSAIGDRRPLQQTPRSSSPTTPVCQHHSVSDRHIDKHRWIAFRDALTEALHESAWRAFEIPRPEDRERLAKPIYRLNDTGSFRCKVCAALILDADDSYFDRCTRWHKPIPL